jgi:integrase
VSRAELIYPIKERIEKELAKAENDPFNCDILRQYYMVRTTQVSPATVLTELIWLNTLSKMLGKKFIDATTDDMVGLNFKLDQRGNKDTTKNRTRRILKRFYQWLRGYPDGQYPPEVAWIKMKRLPLSPITAEDLIPFEEAVRISEFALNLRDRFLVQGKVDAGCRIGEILTMKIGEVQFNDAGAVGYSDGKTGYQPLIFTWSAKTLAQWLNIHPFRQDKEAPVFCLIEREKPAQMSYSAAYRAFKKCVVKAGMNKRVWFHLLKHVSCTEDSKRGMPDSYRKFKHHWSPNSKMSAVYEHLSSADIPTIQADTWKRFMGVQIEGQQTQQAAILLTKKCKRCDFENPRDSKYCNRCAFCLEYETIHLQAVTDAKTEELLTRIRKDPEILAKLLEIVEHNPTGR